MRLSAVEEGVLARVDGLVDEMVEVLRELVRIPTVNPPGDAYAAFAERAARHYRRMGYGVELIRAEGHPDDSDAHPRVNVVARLDEPGPCLHFNAHLDVVPPGQGWSVDPFGGEVRDGRVYGRGTCDMKSGLVASLFAVEAIRRAGVRLRGAIEQSATVDEESGGFAGVAYLAERGRLAADRQQYVVITEPLDPDRVCLGHRGVYWFEVTVRGRMAHGSMPFLGENAIEKMGLVLAAFEGKLKPELARRVTSLPVVPAGARAATLNTNAVAGGQRVDEMQTPCVADRCAAIFDRRFLPEESFEQVRAEIVGLLDGLGVSYELRDRMVVLPTATAEGAAVVRAMRGAIEQVVGRPAALVASPGTYDQKHFSRIAGVREVIAYGPGRLELAHQPDEYVAIADLAQAARVMALGAMRLLGG